MTTRSTTEQVKMAVTDIMPLEVWDMLLNKIEDPKDLYAAHNTCSALSKLLANKRSTFLFTHVLPILMENGFVKDYQNRQEDKEKLDKKLLSVRGVCKRWKSGFDAYFQSWETFLRHRSNKLAFQFECFKFACVEDVENFMEKMATSTSNDSPIYTGRIFFTDFRFRVDNNEPFEFWEAVISTLLPKLGEHILYCHIDSLSCQVEPSWTFPMLAQILSQMPALRYLDLGIYGLTDLGVDVDRTPLPSLKNLKMLEVTISPATVVNELLRAATKGSLQTIDMEFCRFEQKEELRFNSFLWKLLPQLSSLEDVTLPQFESYFSLIKMSNGSSTIKKLNLTVVLFDCGSEPWQSSSTRRSRVGRQMPGGDEISISRLFRALSSLGDKSTLRELSVGLKGPGKIGLDLRLNLPSLEHLHVYSDDDGRISVNSLDFAVEMKALKSLSICADDRFPSRKNRKELIKFSGFVTDMKRSNIWTVLPNLEKLFLSLWYADAHHDHEYIR